MSEQWQKFVFRPTDPFKMRWDIVIMVFSLFNCFAVPIKVCFNPPNMENSLFTTFNYLIDFFFFLDLIVSF